MQELIGIPPTFMFYVLFECLQRDPMALATMEAHPALYRIFQSTAAPQFGKRQRVQTSNASPPSKVRISARGRSKAILIRFTRIGFILGAIDITGVERKRPDRPRSTSSATARLGCPRIGTSRRTMPSDCPTYLRRR